MTSFRFQSLQSLYSRLGRNEVGFSELSGEILGIISFLGIAI